MNIKSIRLVKCKTCNGTGSAGYCGDFYCDGDHKCVDCGGKGKRLNPAARKIKVMVQKLLDLLEYR